MSRGGKDNENGLSRKATKSHDTNKQDGGREEDDTEKKATGITELTHPSSHNPRIQHLEGLHLDPTSLPKCDDIPSGYGGTEMKKFSRKKVGDENSQEENEPLKISVLGLKQDKEMENERKMDDIDLNEADQDEGTGEKSKPEMDEKERVTLQAAVDVFSSGLKKDHGNELDLNKNTSKGDRDGEGSNIDNPTAKTSTKPVPFHISNRVERGDSFTIATKDDVDAGSVYSLYMENDFRYHFQHPYFRLFCAYFVVFCNFLIYAEDPVAHSRKECNIPVIGNDFAFVAIRWPPNAWSLFKVFMWLAGTFVGIAIGKVVIHELFFNRVLRLKMFYDDKGSWMMMFLSTILFVFIFSQIYNLFLLIGGDSTDDYRITSYVGLSNSIFMKAAATGTWCGDFFTAWMVTDMMLQERLYPGWAKPARKWWNAGIRRIVLFWIVVALSSFIVLFVIATDYINWDKLNRDFLHSNEISRAFLASFILVVDITIVMQDWDFPHFTSAIDIKLPGLNTAHIRFKIPKLLKKLEYWHIHISGKWFNYGILFIVIILDLNMWKNQMFYKPFDYGQYVDSEGRIHTVKDEYSLDLNNRTVMSFAYRNSTINPLTNLTYIMGDSMMNARFNDYSMSLKGLAFIPSIGIFLVFGLLVIIYGRMPKPTKDNPYAGRLKKRRRMRFSARKKWNSLRNWISDSTPVLNAFRRRRETSSMSETDRRKHRHEQSKSEEENNSLELQNAKPREEEVPV